MGPPPRATWMAEVREDMVTGIEKEAIGHHDKEWSRRCGPQKATEEEAEELSFMQNDRGHPKPPPPQDRQHLERHQSRVENVCATNQTATTLAACLPKPYGDNPRTVVPGYGPA